jgi:hypothetical protein
MFTRDATAVRNKNMDDNGTLSSARYRSGGRGTPHCTIELISLTLFLVCGSQVRKVGETYNLQLWLPDCGASLDSTDGDSGGQEGVPMPILPEDIWQSRAHATT